MSRGGCVLLLLAVACGLKPAPQSPAQSLRDGWNQFRLGEFDLALRAFERATGDEELAVPALFGTAQTWHLRRPDQDFEKATAAYREVIARAPRSEYAAWSWLALARMKLMVGADKELDLAAIEPGFQAVWANFPEHPAGHEAFLAWQGLKAQAKSGADWRDVIAAVDSFLVTHPQTRYASAAHSLRAHCFRMLGEPAQELAAVRLAWELEEHDPLNPKRNPVATYWRIATLAEFDLGDFATAREFYRRLIAEYPTEQRVFLAKQELKRMDEIEAQVRRELAAGGR